MRDEHRFREKIQLSLENRHVVGLAFAALLLLGAAFSLGVLVGKRLASRAAVPSATDDLEALDAEHGVQQSSVLPGQPSVPSAQTPPAAQTAHAAPARRGSDNPVLASAHRPDEGRAPPAGRASADGAAPRPDPSEASGETAKAQFRTSASGQAANPSPRSTASGEAANASSQSNTSSDPAKNEGTPGKTGSSPAPPAERGRTASARQVPEPPSSTTVLPARPSTVQAPQVGTLPEPPLDAGKFTVQVGATQDRAEARELVARVTKSALRPYVVRTELPGKGLWYRVRVGAFTDRMAAERYRKDLERELRMPALVMPSR